MAAYTVTDSVDPEWAHWRRSFSQLGVTAPAGLGFLTAALIAALALTLAFLAVVPARRTWFTRYGAATMYAYLLHGFITQWLSYQPWYYRRLAGWQAFMRHVEAEERRRAKAGMTMLRCVAPSTSANSKARSNGSWTASARRTETRQPSSAGLSSRGRLLRSVPRGASDARVGASTIDRAASAHDSARSANTSTLAARIL